MAVGAWARAAMAEVQLGKELRKCSWSGSCEQGECNTKWCTAY